MSATEPKYFKMDQPNLPTVYAWGNPFGSLLKLHFITMPGNQFAVVTTETLGFAPNQTNIAQVEILTPAQIDHRYGIKL